MLVVARWPQQRIVIDGQVWVTVQAVSANGRVLLAIEAPRHITVDREEVHERKQAQEQKR